MYAHSLHCVNLFIEVSVHASHSIFNLQLCACHLVAKLY